MKTKKQILEWLDKQSWKNEFYEEFFKNDNKAICYNENFIRYAFNWFSTDKYDLWKLRNAYYRDWYNSNDKPMSWEDYCEQNPIKENEYFINGNCEFKEVLTRKREPQKDANVLSKELCEAFMAYMKLVQLRNAWVKDAACVCKILSGTNKELTISTDYKNSSGLSFPTYDMAEEFITTFEDLLETAKPLL